MNSPDNIQCRYVSLNLVKFHPQLPQIKFVMTCEFVSENRIISREIWEKNPEICSLVSQNLPEFLNVNVNNGSVETGS